MTYMISSWYGYIKAKTHNLLPVSVLFGLYSLLINKTARFKSLSPLGGLGERLAPCGLILWDVLLVNIWLQVQRSAPVPTQLRRMVAQYIHLVSLQAVNYTCLWLRAVHGTCYVKHIVHQIHVCMKSWGFPCHAWNPSFSLQGTGK